MVLFTFEFFDYLLSCEVVKDSVTCSPSHSLVLVTQA